MNVLIPMGMLSVLWVAVAFGFTQLFNSFLGDKLEVILTFWDTCRIFGLIITARFLAAPLAFIFGFGSPERSEELEDNIGVEDDKKEDSK